MRDSRRSSRDATRATSTSTPGQRAVRLDRVCRALGTYAGLLVAVVNVAHAQKPQPELRLDALGPRSVSIEPGLGLNFRMGNYVRLGLAAGYNVRPNPGAPGNAWRGDILTRFTFDPFREQRWALSVGGGLSVRRETYLAAIIDLEGPEVAGLMPAVQAGVSGGARAALILRRAVRGRR